MKTHLWRILLWTVAALAVTQAVANSVDMHEAVQNHRLPLLLTACLIGLLPTSGPHLVFVTLYAEQAIPLSILLASCVVQEGHGMIPTLAHSRRAFVAVKTTKLVAGLGLGLVGHVMGW